jgi:hypothetical protein
LRRIVREELGCAKGLERPFYLFMLRACYGVTGI